MIGASMVERPEAGAILRIARKELRATVASRWFRTWVAAFVGLAAVLVLVALPGSRIEGAAGYGRTAASLVTLVQVIVPLMGLALGAMSLAGQKESGALRFLMSHPVSRTEAFWGIYLGVAAALAVASFAGFGAAGAVTALRGAAADVGPFMLIAAASWVLAAAMAGLGMLISVHTSRSASALGAAVFAWLVLVFIGDLGLMGTSAATDMPVSALFISASLNPVEAFRLTAITALGGSLDALGPAGVYAVDTLGESLPFVLSGVLGLWLAAPAAAAWRRFRVKADL